MKNRAIRVSLGVLCLAMGLMLGSGCHGWLACDKAAAPAAAVVAPERETLQRDLAAIFSDARFANAFWGVRVETIGGEVLFDLNGDKNFAPASNLKLLTSAAGLSLLGPDFRYETRLDAVGSVDGQGRLEGDLVIVGSGDPSFGAWHPEGHKDSSVILAEWAAAVKEAGIREVEGHVLGDGRYFTPESYSGFWEYGDLPYWYSTVTGGLACEENAYRSLIMPGKSVGDAPVIEITPDAGYVTIINEAKTVESGGKNTVDAVWRETEGNVVRYAGTIPVDAEPKKERGSIYDGSRYTAWLLKRALEKEGIVVKGEARNLAVSGDAERIDRAPATQRRRLTTWTSPPLSELCATINQPSHNFFADQLMRTIGKVRKGEGSFDKGEEACSEWFKAIGLPDAEAIQMNDGSGLSRHNMVQPRQICALLRQMHDGDSALWDAYYNSLSIAGVKGWLRARMKDTAAEGRVRAKTGYILRVRSLSGYVPNDQEGMLVFSMIANMQTVSVSTADELIDRAVVLLAQYRSVAGDKSGVATPPAPATP